MASLERLILMLGIANIAVSIVVMVLSVLEGQQLLLLVSLALLVSSLLIIAYSAITVRLREALLEALKLRKPPSKTMVKPRKRYLVFEVIGEVEDLKKKDIDDMLRTSMSRLFGALGVAGSGIRLIYYDEQLHRGVLRFMHVYKHAVIVALSIAGDLYEGRVKFIPIKTTGTLKRAREILNRSARRA